MLALLQVNPSRIAAELCDWASSKHDLEDAHEEFFGRQNREQERQEGSHGGRSQTGDVLEPERNRTHVADHGVAISEIGEGLDIATSEEFFGTGGWPADPFLFEAFDVALSE